MPVLLIIFAVVFWHINNEIESYNMDYYHGKDNGAFVQFNSICVFSTVFFFFMSKRSKILNGILGLLLAVMVSIITYLLIGDGLPFSIISSLMLILIFFIIDYARNKRKKI